MSRATILLGYAALAACIVGCQLVALRATWLPTIGQLRSRVVTQTAGRWLLLAAWLWVGLHLFVRSSH